MKHRFWSEYSEREFALLNRENLVAILPVGAIEQHGPHLPFCVDQAILDGLIAATIDELPDDLPALFLPTLPIGKSNEHSPWPGTLSFSAQTLIAMWMELGDCVAASGVRRFVILNSHGGQIAPMDIVARDLRVRHNMLTVASSWFALGMPPDLFSAKEHAFGIHAGEMETSVMLKLHPELVQMEYAKDFENKLRSIMSNNDFIGLNPSGKIGWQAQDLNPAGACGNAAIANSDKGAKVIAHAAKKIATLLREVSRLPLSFLESTPLSGPSK